MTAPVSEPVPGPPPGPVAWLTGLPSSGKSTLARAVAGVLRARGAHVVLLDGDEVREALRPRPGYDDAARDAFYESLARLAALLAGQGAIVLVPATANRRAFRERARALAPGRFVEVFVDTDLATCRARDAKGLYARAEQEGGGTLPGAGAGYEPPLEPEVSVRPDDADAPGRIAAAIT
jgi:adenylylsulfate kinase